ncbi:MAG TPA: ABC transporter permease subunit [Thermotogota bacterium]|nr:ABC transporter permease subunit [Thermotogota bacterium]
MIRRKRYWPHHIALAIILVVVLFPLFWVASTSVRRDNAAFSNKILGNRYTLQNYVDLLFPAQNLPVVFNDMTNILNLSEGYAEKTQQQLEKKLDKDIARVNQQLDRSEEFFDDMDTRIDKISSFLEDQKSTAMAAFLESKPSQSQLLLQVSEAARQRSQQNHSSVYRSMLLSSLEGGEDSEKFLPLFQQEFPELYNAFTAAQTQVQVFLDSLDPAWSQWETTLAQDPEALTLLQQARERTEALFGQMDFSYSRWFRDVSVKLLNPIGNRVDSLFAETIQSSWEEMVTFCKDTAREVESSWEQYTSAVSEQKQTLSAQSQGEYLQPIQEYEQLQNSIASLQNSLLQKQLEADELLSQQNTNEERLVFLTSQILSNASFFNDTLPLLSSIDTTEPQPSTDPFFAGKVETAFSNLQGIHDFFAKNRGTLLSISSAPEFSRNMDSLLTSLEQWLPNKDAVLEHGGNAAIRDTMGVLLATNQSILLSLEDVRETMAVLEEQRAQVAGVTQQKQALQDQLSSATSRLPEREQQWVAARASEEFASLSLGVFLLSQQLLEITTFPQAASWVNTYQDFLDDHALRAQEMNLSFSPSCNDVLLAWDLHSFVESYTLQKANIKERVGLIRSKLAAFDQRKGVYLSLKLSGATIQALELSEIQDLYSSGYESYSAVLNRIARKANDFSQMEEFGSIRSSLRFIDKQLFYFLQMWEKKPEQKFLMWLVNSVLVAGISAAATVIVCALGAYPFSRMRFPGRRNGLLFLLLIQMFPTVMGMIALYTLLQIMGKYIPGMGLDTLGGLIFVYMGQVAFNMWLLKGYFDTIPDSMEESAMIDGATRFQTFWRIVLPLARPILAVIFILVFFGTYSEFVLARIILQRPDNYTYAVGLQSFSNGPYQMEWGLFTAAALLGAIPMLIVFLSMQRHLVGGLTTGAVKG